ncbi:hypothetical protein [Paenibacillus sp. FSL L8-0499]|uniref:hypothetical protein n=1 Tax=Paenibacillus sp. FSL L8-0499 TaxID=2975334 RepID=UPI0030FB66AB
MTRYKWWFYVFNFSADNKVGNGNGMRRFKKAPTVLDWISVARDVEKNYRLPKGSVVVTNYQPVTK